jgi:hypothetical protein
MIVAKRCKECGKILAENNKSLLCNHHWNEKYKKEKDEFKKAQRNCAYRKMGSMICTNRMNNDRASRKNKLGGLKEKRCEQRFCPYEPLK